MSDRGARGLLVAVILLELVGITARWGTAGWAEQAGKVWLLGLSGWLLTRTRGWGSNSSSGS